MNLEDIHQLVTHGESHTLEFKKSTAQLRAACETICAFLNADGGIVLIGVTDGQHIIGQEVSDKTRREIGIELAKLTPVSNIEVNYLALPDTNRYVIEFHITIDSTKRPFMYDGRAFMRLQSDTIHMPREHVNQLMLINAEGKNAWERQVLSDVILDDLDTKEILATLREGSINGRIPSNFMTDEPWLALQRLGLIENNKINNAGLILFGKCPERKYPQCVLRLARFRGNDKSEFIDNKQCHGNIFQLLNAAMTFASTHLPVASTFPKGELFRRDTPLFPILALREAIANALCHRDYSYYGGNVSFAIYDNRLEIGNYGLFPPGVTLTNLKSLNRSVPRNQLIANVLYYHKIFESWGRGVQMIMSECKKAGHPEPFYSQDGVGTTLTLPSYQTIGVGVIQNIQTHPLTTENLTDRQLEIIALLNENHSLSTDSLRKLMKNPPSDRWLRSELTRLKEQGFIYVFGQTTARKWRLLK